MYPHSFFRLLCNICVFTVGFYYFWSAKGGNTCYSDFDFSYMYSRNYYESTSVVKLCQALSYSGQGVIFLLFSFYKKSFTIFLLLYVKCYLFFLLDVSGIGRELINEHGFVLVLKYSCVVSSIVFFRVIVISSEWFFLFSSLSRSSDTISMNSFSRSLCLLCCSMLYTGSKKYKTDVQFVLFCVFVIWQLPRINLIKTFNSCTFLEVVQYFFKVQYVFFKMFFACSRFYFEFSQVYIALQATKILPQHR